MILPIIILSFLPYFGLSQDISMENRGGRNSEGRPTGRGGKVVYTNQGSKSDRAPNGHSYCETRARQNMLSDNAPEPFVPTPYVYIPGAKARTIKEGKEHYRGQIKRREELRQQIKGMDQYEQRSSVLDFATGSMKISRDSYLADEFDEGNIAAEIADTLLDLATSMTPGVSWARDVYEAISGTDLHSGEELNSFARSMAVMGTVTFGFASKAQKAVNVIEKLATFKTAFHRIEQTEKFQAVRKLLYDKPLAELKGTIGFLKKHNLVRDNLDENAVSFTNAFMKNAKVKVLDRDTVVSRYYGKGSYPRGSWVTTSHITDPVEELALPQEGIYSVQKWLIPKGTEVLDGIVAPMSGKKGGAQQFLVNKKLLQEFVE